MRNRFWGLVVGIMSFCIAGYLLVRSAFWCEAQFGPFGPHWSHKQTLLCIGIMLVASSFATTLWNGVVGSLLEREFKYGFVGQLKNWGRFMRALGLTMIGCYLFLGVRMTHPPYPGIIETFCRLVIAGVLMFLLIPIGALFSLMRWLQTLIYEPDADLF